MQRQKTIAKWLAVILLLTVALACYIAFGTDLIKKAPDNIAGADGDSNNSSGGQQTTEPPRQPVYSVLPRDSELVDGMIVSHVGGEDDETFLASYYIGSKLLVFFQTESKEYDVKESGIYVARYENDKLMSATKICSDEQYVCSTLGASGIVFITKTDSVTVLRTVNSSGLVTARNTAPAFDSYKLFTQGRQLYMFACDSRYAYAYTVSQNLDLASNNYVYNIVDGNLLYALQFGKDILLCAQSGNDIILFSFNANKGFNYKNSLIKASLLQLMPFVNEGQSALAILAKTDRGICLLHYDLNCVLKYSYEILNQQSACLLRKSSTFLLVTQDKSYTLCNHFDLIEETALDGIEAQNDLYDETAQINGRVYEQLQAKENLRFENIDGSADKFLIHTDSGFALCTLKNSVIKVSFCALTQSQNIDVTELAYVKSAMQGTAEFNTILCFCATVKNNFAYMSFGKQDVYTISLLT